MGRAGLKPDCALIADEAKDTGPVDVIREILSANHLVPGDSQITAAVDSISIAASSKIDGKKTVLTSNDDLTNYGHSQQYTEKDDLFRNAQS